MKRLINLSAILILVSIFSTTAFAQSQQNNQNRKMVKAQSMQSTTGQGVNWVDADGDGICDNFGTNNQGSGNGKGYGLKDGTNGGTRPQDGTGFGKMNGAGNGSGTGVCDGTGSKGNSRRGGRK
jgi:hypothetical protein